MAKKPDDSRRPHPDDPNDPRAAGTPRPAPEETDSDSAINLGEHIASGDLSGISVIEWASLVEEPKPTGGASQVKIDSPSDAELIAQLSDQPAPPPAPSLDEDVLFEEDVPAATTPASAVDLGEEVIVAELVDSGVALAQPADVEPPGEDLVDLGDELGLSEPSPVLADDAIDYEAVPTHEPELQPASFAPAEDDVVEIAEEAFDAVETAEADHEEGFDPAALPLEAVSAQPAATDADVLDLSEVAEVEEAGVEFAVESGVDLGSPAGASARGEPVAESSIDLMAENLLFEQPAAPASGGSSRDLIAEGLESGVDLLGTKKPPVDDSEDALDNDFFAQVAALEHSSSVDLGSAHTIDVFTEEEAEQAAEPPARGKKAAPPAAAEPADLDVEEAEEETPVGAAVGEPSEMDLDMMGMFDAKESSPPNWREGATEEMEPSPKQAKKGAAAAVVEDDEGVVEEEEKPKKGKKGKKEAVAASEAPGKRRGTAGAWVGGTVLGTLIGAGACVGVWFAGLVPETSAPKPPPVVAAPAAPQGPTPAELAAQAVEKIRAGQIAEVKPEVLANVEKPEDLLARAELNWLNYLRAERGKNPQAPLNAAAEPVKQALADLDKAVAANLPEALHLRGQIHEMTNNEAAARADYQLGARQFAANPAEKARFETALQVLDLGRKLSHLAPPGVAPGLLALLLINLQQPPPAPGAPGVPAPPAAPGAPAPGAPAPGAPAPGAPAPGAPDVPAPPAVPGAPAPGAPAAAPLPEEAGFRYWQAALAAQKKDYDAALKAIDEARALHDQRRYLLPRRQQNPASDPREQIFLNVCELLKDYWRLQAVLNNPDYLTATEKRDMRVDALLGKADVAARADQLKKLAADLVKDKPVAKPEDLVKLIDEERKAAETKLTMADETITGQKKQLDGLTDKLKTAGAELTKTAETLTKTVEAEKAARAAGQQAVALLKEVGGVVGSDFADVKTSKETLLDDVRATARMARVVDPMGKIRQLERDLAEDRARLAQRWEPAQMLAAWLPILQNDRDRLDLAARAREDVARVMADPFAKPLAKAQAQLVQGLVLRNEDNFTAARTTLGQAHTGLVSAGSDWAPIAAAALAETAAPAASFASRAAALHARGKVKEAQALLARGLKVAPAPKGPLYLQRARFAYEAARSKGAIKAADPLVASARVDAAEAAKEGLAEGHYLAGRLAEDLGQIDDAIRSYRAAIAGHAVLDETGSRYRIALARALLKQQPGSLPAPEAIPPATRTGRAPQIRGLDAVVLLVALTLQEGVPTEKPASTPEQLADEVLALGDKAPFDARAQALAIKGLYTRALQVYTAGLRDNGLLAPEHANTLLELLQGHPVLRRPESKEQPDPLRGERHYASGLNQFFAGQYARAEKEFLSAVENDKNDARYHYYLGLTRLAQGKREAHEDFDQGARLERQGRPDTTAVSAALERVQGPMRKLLNAARTRPARNTLK